MRRLRGSVMVVAGGGSGIGAAVARRLASEGARVVIGDLHAAAAERVATSITQAGGEAIGHAFDIANAASNEALIARALDNYGSIGGVHVNAADMSAGLGDANVVDLDMAIFDRLVAVNLKGHFLLTKAAVPALLRSGGGALLYTASAAAFVGLPALSAYPATKLAVTALVRHVAATWGSSGVRANAVAPGLVLSEQILATTDEAQREFALSMTPSPRLGQVDDVAAAAAFLLSAEAEWINGQVLSVDGGATMR